jgi:Protein of unknown function (DUF1761)
MPEIDALTVVAATVAGFAIGGAYYASLGEIDEVSGGLALGVALWIGFPFVLWTGAVVHENAPVELAVIHGGDWLLKLLAVAVIASVVP